MNEHVHSADVNGNTPLMKAVQSLYNTCSCSTEDILHIKELLSYGADVNKRNRENFSAFEIWCKIGQSLELGQVLLDAGATSTRCFNLAVNNWMINEDNGFEEFLCTLLDKGADPNKHDTNSTNLIKCIRKGMLKASRALIKHGAKVNRTDENNKTALLIACDLANAELRNKFVSILVENGADINQESSPGYTPLYVLVKAITRDLRRNYKLLECDDSVIRIDLEPFNLLVQGGATLKPFLPEDKKIYSTSEIYQKSALYILITNGLFKAAMFLVNAGWDISKEAWFEDLNLSKLHLETCTVNHTQCKRVGIEKMVEDFKSFVDSLDKGPKKLTTLCRNVIRYQLQKASTRREIQTAIRSLSLPPPIKSFLRISHHHCEELIRIEYRYKQRQRVLHGHLMDLFPSRTTQEMFRPYRVTFSLPHQVELPRAYQATFTRLYKVKFSQPPQVKVLYQNVFQPYPVTFSRPYEHAFSRPYQVAYHNDTDEVYDFDEDYCESWHDYVSDYDAMYDKCDKNNIRKCRNFYRNKNNDTCKKKRIDALHDKCSELDFYDECDYEDFDDYKSENLSVDCDDDNDFRDDDNIDGVFDGEYENEYMLEKGSNKDNFNDNAYDDSNDDGYNDDKDFYGQNDFSYIDKCIGFEFNNIKENDFVDYNYESDFGKEDDYDNYDIDLKTADFIAVNFEPDPINKDDNDYSDHDSEAEKYWDICLEDFCDHFQMYDDGDVNDIGWS